MSGMKNRNHVVSVLLFPWLITATAAAAPVFVDPEGTCVPKDGSSWCNAYDNLQIAIALATINTEIRVAQGTYRPDGGTGDRLATFLLKDGVVINGGYAGFGEADPDARDVALYETILSGDLNGDDGPDFANYADNSYHILTYNDPNAEDVVLDGFTISHGNADGTGPAGTITNQGGAIHIRGNSQICIPGGPTIRNCIIRDNWAAHHGAVNNHSLASTIENCTFVDNFAGVQGGGLLIHSGSATVTNCQFISNQTGSVVGEGAGGGVWLGRDTDPVCDFFPKPVFTDCLFRDNNSRNDGGGLYSLPGNHPSLVRCTFENNSADNDGGGVFDQGNSLGDYVDSTFSGNQAGHYGGALYSYAAKNTLDNCQFTANTAIFKGGGIYGGGDVQGCSFIDNSSAQGGGFYGVTETVVENCTFTQNHASATVRAGGGFFGGPFTGAEVRGCTFRQNTTPGFGGGLVKDYQSQPMIVEGCTFIANTARGGGGMYTTGVFSDDPTVSVSNCRFFGNVAVFGGGSYLYHGIQTFVNCAFTGNIALDPDAVAVGKGGAVLSASDDTTLINCTLYGNTADEGGGLYSQTTNDPNSHGAVLVANSILWGNSDSSGSGQAAQIFNQFDSAPVVNYSSVQGWDGTLSGTGVLDSDPLIGDPDGADDVLGTEDDDLNLVPGSPAIDAGDNAALPPEVIFDLAGNPRISSGTVDIGAYEAQFALPPIPTVTAWGLMAMMLLVMAAGTVVLRRVRPAT